MLIVKADEADLKSILELQYLAYQSEAKLLNNFSIPPLKQTFEEVELQYKRGSFLKAIDENNVIIGSVRAYINNDTSFIEKLIVLPDKQRQGIGTKLLLKIEKECPAARYELFTSDKSVNNIKLYERLGYVRFREKKINENLTFIYLEKYVNIL